MTLFDDINSGLKDTGYYFQHSVENVGGWSTRQAGKWTGNILGESLSGVAKNLGVSPVVVYAGIALLGIVLIKSVVK